MRFQKYIALSSMNDNDTATFRSFDIKMVESSTDNMDIVNKISEVYSYDNNISELIQKANKKLKSLYRGKMKFDLCIENQGFHPDKVKMEERTSEKVKSLWFELNDELSSIQTDFESYLSNLK